MPKSKAPRYNKNGQLRKKTVWSQFTKKGKQRTVCAEWPNGRKRPIKGDKCQKFRDWTGYSPKKYRANGGATGYGSNWKRLSFAEREDVLGLAPGTLKAKMKAGRRRGEGANTFRKYSTMLRMQNAREQQYANVANKRPRYV